MVLVPDPNSDPATNILEALQALENLLQKKEKRAILFLDEMQEIGEVAEGSGIKGAIRHVAQTTEYLFMILYGGPGALDQTYLLPQMLKLAKNNEIIFYDQRGSGSSLDSKIDNNYISVEQFIKDLEELRGYLELEKLKKVSDNYV
jgi:pimeloyl-ACP methyl ester carboxylesterase